LILNQPIINTHQISNCIRIAIKCCFFRQYSLTFKKETKDPEIVKLRDNGKEVKETMNAKPKSGAATRGGLDNMLI